MSSVLERLRLAREKLDAKDIAGAIEIYDGVLAEAGERADVLVTISGDLGSTGYVAQIVELISPRYDAARHGPATGINLLQAYLAIRDAGSAQHVLDLLFSLNRPDLEDRLFGFSNAIGDLLLQSAEPISATLAEAPDGSSLPSQAPKVSVIAISRPLWSYGLEALLPRILPEKSGRLRRVAFVQLALPGGYPDFDAAMAKPGDEIGGLSRALPAWLAETFYFSAGYQSFLAIPFVEEPGGARHPLLFDPEWTVEHLRQLADTIKEDLDYAVTGALRHRSGDYELILRVWELKKFRERKQFAARWTPGTANAELAKLREVLGHFMEWKPCPPGTGIDSVPPEQRPWIGVLGASLDLFLAEKGFLPRELLAPAETLTAEAARLAPASAIASVAWLTLVQRCLALGLPIKNNSETPLADDPLVSAARQTLGL